MYVCMYVIWCILCVRIYIVGASTHFLIHFMRVSYMRLQAVSTTTAKSGAIRITELHMIAATVMGVASSAGGAGWR